MRVQYYHLTGLATQGVKMLISLVRQYGSFKNQDVSCKGSRQPSVESVQIPSMRIGRVDAGLADYDGLTNSNQWGSQVLKEVNVICCTWHASAGNCHDSLGTKDAEPIDIEHLKHKKP